MKRSLRLPLYGAIYSFVFVLSSEFFMKTSLNYQAVGRMVEIMQFLLPIIGGYILSLFFMENNGNKLRITLLTLLSLVTYLFGIILFSTILSGIESMFGTVNNADDLGAALMAIYLLIRFTMGFVVSYILGVLLFCIRKFVRRNKTIGRLVIAILSVFIFATVQYVLSSFITKLII